MKKLNYKIIMVLGVILFSLYSCSNELMIEMPKGPSGASAYELWVEEVAKGIENPHDLGVEWPKDKTSPEDFWEFLRGKDGRDGLGGETGQPGANIKIIPGKANVISQYSSQEFNEFIRTGDGGVGYVVYDDAGTIAAGAKVKGLPGVLDPDKEYTSDASGYFLVPKEDLPENASRAKRTGATASVTYQNSQGAVVTEASAANTYVPNRMYIRLRAVSDMLLTSVDMNVTVVVERKTDGGTWRQIPTYLGNLSQRIVAYRLSDPSDPASYDAGNAAAPKYVLNYNSSVTETAFNISLPSTIVRIARLRKTAAYYITPAFNLRWDGIDNHYFTLVMESYYGEKPQMPAVLKMAPVQAMPMITASNVKAYTFNNSADGFFLKIEGELDIPGAVIDNNLLFKAVMHKDTLTVNSVEYTYYTPEKETRAVVDGAKQFRIRFNHTDLAGQQHNMLDEIPTLLNPAFSISTPYLNATIVLESSGHYFYGLGGSIGQLSGTYNGANFGGTLQIHPVNTAIYLFPAISIQYIP